MAPKVVLLANDRVFNRLQLDGLLRSNFLTGQAGSEFFEPPSTPDAPRIDRWSLEQIADGADAADQEKIDQRFALLVNSVVCHLVLVGPEMDEGEVTIDWLVAWLKTFGKSSAESIPDHRRHYRHVAIVVTITPFGDADMGKLGSLLKDDVNGVDAVYFMASKLELGNNECFHARHVWPIAVSLLLYKLATVPLGDDEKGRIIAWRSRQIEPLVGDQLATAAFAEVQSTAFADYRGQISSSDAAPEENPFFIGRESIEDPVLQPAQVGQRAFWQEFGAVSRSEKVLSLDHWQRQFRREGHKFVGQRSRRVLAAMDSLERAVADRWRDVHRLSANLYRQRRSASATRPDFQKRATEVRSKSDALVQVDQKLQLARESLRADSKEFDLAAGFYLYFGLRMLVSLLVAIAIIWASHVVYFYFNLWQVWLAIAAAGTAGAFLPPLAFWFLERYRGERAMNDLVRRYKEFDNLTESRFNDAWELFDTASQFCIDLRTFAAWTRTQRLLARTEAVIDLAFDELPTAGEEPKEPTEPGAPAVSSQQRALELAQFRRLSICPVDAELFNISNTDDLKRVVAAEAIKFARRWTPLCDRCDPKYRGMLMARQMLPSLEQLRDEFHLAIEAELTKLMLTTGGQELAQKCLDAARESHVAAWHYGMSAAVPSRGIDDVRRLLLLNPGFRSTDFQAGRATLVSEVCLALGGRATCAIVHEEITLNDVTEIDREEFGE